MWTRRVTIGALVVALALLIGWDIYVATNDLPGDTISELVLGFSRRVVTLPFAIGVVAGHLLWPNRRVIRGVVTICILATITVITIVADVVGHPPIVPVIPFAFGVVIGHLGWGQREE